MWFQCSSRQHHGDWWWSDSGSETCGREIENKRVESELEFLWPLKRYLIWLKQGHSAPISFYHDLIKQSSKFKLSARGGRLQNIASFCEFQIEVCQKNIKSISSHQDLQLWRLIYMKKLSFSVCQGGMFTEMLHKLAPWYNLPHMLS